MSAIGSTGYGLQVQFSPYAGTLRANSDSDAARAAATHQSVDADHRAYSDAGLHETAETGRSSDRDAGGFFAFDDTKEGRDKGTPASDATDSDSETSQSQLPRKRRLHDDHRGNLIDVQV